MIGHKYINTEIIIKWLFIILLFQKNSGNLNFHRNNYKNLFDKSIMFEYD